LKDLSLNYTNFTKNNKAMALAPDQRLAFLEQKVEERLYDTRSIWEAVQSRLDHIKTKLDRLETRPVQFQTEVREQLDYIRD
jgi:hypothetical protein